MGTETIVTGEQLRALADLADREGLPHPSAPGVTWATLRWLYPNAMISRRECVGCFAIVRTGVWSDHVEGCPTGQNGTPNYE